MGFYHTFSLHSSSIKCDKMLANLQGKKEEEK
jgi:hypothetical protein